MRTTLEEALVVLSKQIDAPDFGRVDLARSLIRLGAAHAVAIADLGREPGEGAVTRSVVVQAADQAALSSLLHRLARGPLPDLARLGPRMEEVPSPVHERGPGPIEVPSSVLGPELRMVRADEVEVRTYFGLFGAPGSSGVKRGWRGVLTELAPSFSRLLDRTRVRPAEVEGSIAVSAEGQLLAADTRAGPWLEADKRAERLPTLLRIARAGDAVDGPLDGARVHLRAADGPLGEAWLGSIRSPSSLERALDSLLTPTQREVAGYAAVGATCAEIASTLGTRVETVRTHVRDIYARLGISTRAELARRWASLDEEAAPVGPARSSASTLRSAA